LIKDVVENKAIVRKAISLTTFLLVFGLDPGIIYNYFEKVFPGIKHSRLYTELDELSKDLKNNPKAKSQFDVLVYADLAEIDNQIYLTEDEKDIIIELCEKTLLTPNEFAFMINYDGVPGLDVKDLSEVAPEKLDRYVKLAKLSYKFRKITIKPYNYLDKSPKELKQYFKKKVKIIKELDREIIFLHNYLSKRNNERILNERNKLAEKTQKDKALNVRAEISRQLKRTNPRRI
jgi:hypothetical protein